MRRMIEEVLEQKRLLPISKYQTQSGIPFASTIMGR